MIWGINIARIMTIVPAKQNGSILGTTLLIGVFFDTADNIKQYPDRRRNSAESHRKKYDQCKVYRIIVVLRY